MAEATEATDSKGSTKLTLTIELASFVLLVGYLAVTTLQQSDVELILPTSKFDLGGLLEQFKDGIPGGAFVAPILKVEVPLSLFYTVGPVVLLLLHLLVVLRPGPLRAAEPPLRWLAIWLPPATIALIRWRFTSFVEARPAPPLPGQFLERLQTAALVADIAIVTAAMLPWTFEATWPGQVSRLWAGRLRMLRHAVITSCVAILTETWLTAPPEGATQIISPTQCIFVAAGLFLLWLLDAWRERRGPYSSGQGHPAPATKTTEDLDMTKRMALAATFTVFFALPVLAHGPDFSDESLVARSPSETMLSAYITAVASRLPVAAPAAEATRALREAREDAWDTYGRGITLNQWKFPRASFEDATMVKIKLNHAILTSASFEHADLQQAELNGVQAGHANFRDAEAPQIQLVGAYLPGADFTGANLNHGRLNGIVRVAEPTPASQPPSATKPSPTATPCSDQSARTNFSYADFSDANLQDADLTCAIMRGVTMNSRTNLKGATLDHADFCGAHLQGVDFRPALSVETAVFNWADIRKSKFPFQEFSALSTGAPFQAVHAFIAGTSFTLSDDDTPAKDKAAPVRVSLKGANLQSLSRHIDGQTPDDPTEDNTSHCDKP